MSPQATVRAQARDALHHRYAAALLGFVVLILVFSAVEGFVSALTYLSMALVGDSDVQKMIDLLFIFPVLITAIVLVSPVMNGYIRLFYRNALTDHMDPSDLYYYFRRGYYTRALRLNLSFILRLLLPAFLSFLPVLIYNIVVHSIADDFTATATHRVFFFILCVLSTVILTLWSLRYFTVFTLLVENEEFSNGELFILSRRIMRGHAMEAAKLVFSYTPWMLVCMTVLPLLYVVPYMTQGLCIGAKWMTRAAYEVNR